MNNRLGSRPHIFLLTVDSLRADHLPSYGYERETAPFLTKFTREHTWFSNCFSASSHTRESVPALLTGRYPNDCVTDGYELAGPTIADRLGKAGYATAAFHSNPFISRAYGFGSPFDHFDDGFYFSQSRIGALAQRVVDKLRNRHYTGGMEINEAALSWVDGVRDESVFVWNHYMDVHGPYQPPRKYREQFADVDVTDRDSQRLYKRTTDDSTTVSPDERRNQIDLYDAEIRYVDDVIESFLDGLRKRGLYENSIIVVSSDHGDAFGECGYYGHPRFLDEVLTHVPLLVKAPDLPGGEVSFPTSTVDIVPTLLSALDIVDGEWAGLPLQSVRDDSEHQDRVVFAQARSEDTDAPLRRYRAFSTDGRAWAEVRHGSDDRVEIEGDETLREPLRNHISRWRDIAVPTHRHESEPSSAVEARLRSLGYR